MSDHPHRTAKSVLGKRLQWGTPVACPVCRLPFRDADLVVRIDCGVVHAFCGGES